MRIESSNLNFHSTFSPQLMYVSKLLQLAKNNYIGDELEISKLTGIPTGESTGKVVPHLHYAKYMGLINYEKSQGKYELNLTSLGKVVSNEDPHLIENLTKLLLHYMITDFKIGAPHWSFLFRVFNYSFDELYDIKEIDKKAEEYFAKKCKMSVVKRSYENECFDDIRVIEVDGKDKIKFNQLFHRFDFSEVYAYTLLNSWESYFENYKEITINQLINEIKWNKPFGLDYDSTLEVLDELSALGYIKLNKQLSPITIIKLAASDEVLSGIYRSLI